MKYYIARWYDSEIAHFLQTDTMVSDAWSIQAWNKYGYVYYNPINSIDLTGHLTERQIREWTGRKLSDFSPEIQEMLIALTSGDSLSGFNGSSYYNYGTMGLDEFGNLVFGSFTLDDIIANQGELFLSRTVGGDTYIPWASWGISDNNGPNNIERVGWEEVFTGREYEITYSLAGGIIAEVASSFFPPAKILGDTIISSTVVNGLSHAASFAIGASLGEIGYHISLAPGQANGDQTIIEQYRNSQGEVWQHETIIRNDQIISYEEYFVIDFSNYNYP